MFRKIYIEITNVCNLKCEFCPETKRVKRFLNVVQFEEIIKKIQNYTNLVCLHVKGEPLLHPELKQILKILDKYNLKANITTNGTLLEKKIDSLKKATSLRQLNISLHSINQNKIRNGLNLYNLFDSVKSLEDVIVSYRLWNLHDLTENNINNNIIEQLEKYYNYIGLKEELRQKSFIKIKDGIYINQDLEFVWPSKNGKVINKEGRCLALKNQIAILVDGSVVPCCMDNDGDIVLGNIFEETLEEILQKPKTLAIKRNFENNIITCNLCKTCGFLKKLENKRDNKK